MYLSFLYDYEWGAIKISNFVFVNHLLFFENKFLFQYWLWQQFPEEFLVFTIKFNFVLKIY